MYQRFLSNIKNIPGKKTIRKLIVFYADDFGSIRIRSKVAKEKLTAAGIKMDNNRYSFDTLASSVDINQLYEVLMSVKDKNGNYACFTPLINIANPDFERIRNSGYTQYFREPFTDTLQRYGYDDVLDLWKQGVKSRLIYPEYHGTEHLNVRKFMTALQREHKSTCLAFKHECVCIPSFEDEIAIKNASTTFDIEHAFENESLKTDINTGLEMFKNILGYTPTQFTPGAGIYSPLLHQSLLDNGIKYIHANRFKSYPLGDNSYAKKFLYNGKTNEVGQKYIVRNSPFEPILDNFKRNEHAVRVCFNNIEAAFNMHSPALISTHRVNFVGGIDVEHRNYSLGQLKLLLNKIINRWPDVEFVTGDQMARIVLE
ncbi:MAG: hypothetical protein PHU68_04600 [Paludibacter sp.]|nr:hypothetical protein [Paludibacter sp.]